MLGVTVAEPLPLPVPEPLLVNGSGVDDAAAVDVVLEVVIGKFNDVLPPPHAQHASMALKFDSPDDTTAEPRLLLQSVSGSDAKKSQLYWIVETMIDH